MTAAYSRTASVTIEDRGYIIVHAEGTAASAWAVSRTAEQAIGMAVYGATYGEFPCQPWRAPEAADEVQHMTAPYAAAFDLQFMGRDGEATAIAQFKVAESVSHAAIRGNYLPAQPYLCDDDLTGGQWDALDTGAAVPLSDGDFAICDSLGYARRCTAGLAYVDADGRTYDLSKLSPYAVNRRYVYDRSTDTFAVLLSVDSKSRATIYTAYGAIVALSTSELQDPSPYDIDTLPAIDHAAIDAAMGDPYAAAVRLNGTSDL